MQIKGAKVAVTGGAGFIGSHLAEQLADPTKRANRVVVFDDFSVGSMDNLAAQKDRSSVEVIKGDVRDLKSLEKAFEGVDVVFHLATNCVRLSLADPGTNHDINATGTLNALMAARKCGVKRFVYCSSSEVYGNSAEALAKINGGLLDEESPKQPTTVYGASKLVGELYTLAYHQTYGLPGMVVRPFNAYGPRSHITGPYGEVIPRFITMIRTGKQPLVFGDGKQTRDFTYVEDTAAGLIACAETDALLGDSINLAHGKEVSVIELARTLSELHGVKFDPKYMPDRPGDIHRLGAEVKKLRSLVGFSAEVAIREGLSRYLKWLDGLGLDFEKIAKDVQAKNW